MAEEILKRVLGSLAAARAAQGNNIAWGLKGELEKLTWKLIMIQVVLQDAEERQITDDMWRFWLDKVRDTAYQAEDVLDELGYEIIQRELETQDSMKGKVCSFFSLSNPIAFGLRLTQEVQKINESFDELQEMATFGLRVLSADTTPQPRRHPMTETDSFLSSLEAVKERGDDVSKIINLLISSCSQQVLSVIPIVGMAGLGKTTVAKMVLQEVNDRELFHVTFWIYVSDSFDDERILEEMMHSLGKYTDEITGMDAIMKHLREELETKTFLLILDNVWNEDYEKWEILKDCLLKISGNNRNVVVVTTRSRLTASIMESQTACSHELKQLSNNECWSIIREIVSRNGESIPSELEAIGIDIAKKCGGVPVVARVLGSMLFCEKDKDKWSSIRDSDAVEMSRDYDQVLEILKLSFDHLPSTSLQRCFSYCSIFPKDFEIEKEKLIQLWMAEGLLGSSVHWEMEDEGDINFNFLLARSFFQDFQTDELGNVICCKMSNLVHDLALMVTKSEIVIQKPDSAIDGTFIRHLNLISSDERNEPLFLKDGARKWRTLFSGFLNKSWEFRSLRSLTLNDARMTELPDSICRLKHLRYLDVSRTDIKALPKSITKLYHLQTLRFSDCRSLKKLPNKMEYLLSLRHIDFSHTPADVGCLTGLRSLPFFEVGHDKGHKVEELGCLKKLRGKLRIVNLEHVRDKEEAKGANLSGKENINTLVLVWSSERESSSSSINYKDVLEGLQPHPDIRSLEIENYQGDEFPQWFFMPILNNLVVLKLKGCKKLPPAGHPSHLEILEIEGMDVVEIIGEEFYSSGGSGTNPIFPTLKRLSVMGMRSLVEWMIPAAIAGGVQVAFPCLEELNINGCPKLESIPSMSHLSSKLVRLTIRDCNALSHISGEFQASATSLKYLTIMRCSNLSSIPSLQSCIALEALSISTCYNLVSSIILESRSLISVFIGWCGKASVRISWPLSYANMKELNIEICGELIFFDDLHGGEVWPSRFQSLVIRCCDQFKSVPDGLKRRLHSLVRLDISWCRNLSHVPEDFFCGLNQLKGLKIGGFSQELEAFPGMNSIQHLGGSLEELKIIGWKKLKSLPHQLQHLTSLTKLKIYGFNGEGFEEALPDWLGNLSSLQELTIWECQNLKYLPSSTAMQSLSKLTRLIIRSCSLLKRNCTEGSGSEWPKISHIPHIDLP